MFAVSVLVSFHVMRVMLVLMGMDMCVSRF